MLKPILFFGALAVAAMMGEGAQAAPTPTTFSNGVISTDLSDITTWVSNEFSAGLFDSSFSGLVGPSHLNSNCNCSYGVGTPFTLNLVGDGSVFGALFNGTTTGLLTGLGVEETALGNGQATFKLISFNFGNSARTLTFNDVSATSTLTGVSTPVPGPIAGSGLPAFAIIALLLVWRRMRTTNAV